MDLLTLGEIGDTKPGVGTLGIYGIALITMDIPSMVDMFMFPINASTKAVDSIGQIAVNIEMREVPFALRVIS